MWVGVDVASLAPIEIRSFAVYRDAAPFRSVARFGFLQRFGRDHGDLVERRFQHVQCREKQRPAHTHEDARGHCQPDGDPTRKCHDLARLLGSHAGEDFRALFGTERFRALALQTNAQVRGERARCLHFRGGFRMLAQKSFDFGSLSSIEFIERVGG